jgi:protease YdgD
MPRILVPIVAAALLATAAAHAQAIGKSSLPSPVLPGIGARDHRTPVPPDAPPWRALGRLQINSSGTHRTCTGALVAPRLVLTAAHCLYDVKVRAYVRPVALHFLLGYSRGAFAMHGQGERLIIGTGYDPKRDLVGTDWALVVLDRAVGTPDRILSLAATPPSIGQEVSIGGYARDFVEIITADAHCHIIGAGADEEGHRFFRHDCTTTFGDSGAPLLVRDGKDWRIAGIATRSEVSGGAGEAASIDEARAVISGQRPNG